MDPNRIKNSMIQTGLQKLVSKKIREGVFRD
jgi:hypothetical protein